MADEIKLAADTLRWLNELRDEEIPEQVRPRMRDLVSNICDFQYGFSLPLDLGLSTHSRSEETLPIERPIGPLVRWKFAFEVSPSEIESFEADDHEKDGERIFCLVGGPTWESQVANGKIEGEGATEPNLNTSEWLLDLFEILGKQSESGNANLKASARRLAACWYNVAMVVSFDKVEEEDMVGLSRDDVMAMMMGGLSLGGDEEYEEFEEDDQEADIPESKPASLIAKLMKGEIPDDDDDEDYDPAKDTRDNGEDEEIEEDDDEADESAKPKEPVVDHATKRKQLAAALLRGELDDDDDDEDYDPEKDSNDDGQDEEMAEDDEEDDGSPAIIDEDAEEVEVEEVEEEEDEETRQKRALEFRTRVLAAIEKLGAQWPSIEDQGWLKRVLKLMSIADEQEKDWFPWGLPALEPLIKSSQSDDVLEKQHALSILSLYQQRQDAVASSSAP